MADTEAERQRKTVFDFSFWLFSCLLIMPWLYIQHQISVNSDVAWLSICAERLMNGGSLLRDCYDTNPPLSILVYTPFIWLSDVLNVPIYHCIFWLTFAFVILGIYSTQKILRAFPVLSDLEKNILLLTYLCSVTIIPTLYYAERDHFLAIILLPFILVQIALTYGYKPPPSVTFLVLILGGIALLLKPYFGLVPAFLLFHRVVTQKRLWIIKDWDFIVLLTLSVSYMVIVLVYFSDFVNVILPDVMQAYLSHNNPRKVYITALPYTVLLAVCFAGTVFVKDKSKAFLLTLATCTLISLTVYALQMKGFTYHRLPLYGLIFPLSSIVLLKFVQNFMNNQKALAFIASTIIFTFAYLHAPLRPLYPTHANYQQNEITNYLDQHCAQPCSFYITYENMDIVSQIALYSNHTYATRFPSFWFLSNLEDNSSANKKERFATYIAEDIERFAPSLILVMAESPAIGALHESETIAGYFAFSPEFEKAMSSYKKTDRLTVDRAYFYKGTPYDFPYLITWDVYKKVPEQ